MYTRALLPPPTSYASGHRKCSRWLSLPLGMHMQLVGTLSRQSRVPGFLGAAPRNAEDIHPSIHPPLHPPVAPPPPPEPPPPRVLIDSWGAVRIRTVGSRPPCGSRWTDSTLQSPHCAFIFVYRHHRRHVGDEWVFKNPNLNPIPAQRRVLGFYFTAVAYKHALALVNIVMSFKKRGYIWPTFDGNYIDLRELPDYQYDPNDALIRFQRKHFLESENANEHRLPRNKHKPH